MFDDDGKKKVFVFLLGMEKVMLAILPTLDHFELAMKNTEAGDDEWKKGIEAILWDYALLLPPLAWKK